MGKTVKQRKRKIGNYEYIKDWRKHARTVKHMIQKPAISKVYLKHSWDKTKNVEQNFDKLGLVFKLKKAMKPPSQYEEENVKKNRKKTKKRKETPFIESRHQKETTEVKLNRRVPPREAKYITYLLNKYGENYKAMVRDFKNHDQETWKQLRKRIRHFKTCVDQYAQFLKHRKYI